MGQPSPDCLVQFLHVRCPWRDLVAIKDGSTLWSAETAVPLLDNLAVRNQTVHRDVQQFRLTRFVQQLEKCFYHALNRPGIVHVIVDQAVEVYRKNIGLEFGTDTGHHILVGSDEADEVVRYAHLCI